MTVKGVQITIFAFTTTTVRTQHDHVALMQLTGASGVLIWGQIWMKHAEWNSKRQDIIEHTCVFVSQHTIEKKHYTNSIPTVGIGLQRFGSIEGTKKHNLL
ncbi:hypothetical protein ACJX0J_018643 [Zea mays]